MHIDFNETFLIIDQIIFDLNVHKPNYFDLPRLVGPFHVVFMLISPLPPHLIGILRSPSFPSKAPSLFKVWSTPLTLVTYQYLNTAIPLFRM
jgi:hypothetical protein